MEVTGEAGGVDIVDTASGTMSQMRVLACFGTVPRTLPEMASPRRERGEAHPEIGSGASVQASEVHQAAP